MSHITRIRTKMVEETYLLAALNDLGYSQDKGNVRTDGQVVRVSTGMGRPNMTLRKEGGAYNLIIDTLFGIPGRKQGGMLQKLTQRYAYHAAVGKLEEQGFVMVNEEIQEGDSIHLVMRRTA